MVRRKSTSSGPVAELKAYVEELQKLRRLSGRGKGVSGGGGKKGGGGERGGGKREEGGKRGGGGGGRVKGGGCAVSKAGGRGEVHCNANVSSLLVRTWGRYDKNKGGEV